MTTSWQPAGDRALRVGLVGLGSMGRNHLRVLSERDDLVLAAIADPVPAALASAPAGLPAERFEMPQSMIAECDLDAAVIAAPTTFHVSLAISAIERGIAVLVEKPIAATVEGALRIAAAARANGTPVQVGHIERFNPAVLELGRLIRSGWLSTIYSVVSRRAGPFPSRIRDVGVTIDLATHDADILSWIVGERPTRVYGETSQRIHATNEDLLFGLLNFPSGALGMIDVNWLTPAKRRQLAVVGEEGMFELDYLTQRLTFTRATDTTNPRLIGGYAPTFEGDLVELPIANTEPLAAEIDAFVSVVRTGDRPIVSVSDGLWAVAIASSLLASASDGIAVDLTRHLAHYDAAR